MKGIARQPKRKPTPTEKRRALVTVTAVFLCGVLFLFSAGDKLLNDPEFTVQVGKSPILTGHEAFVGDAVPWGEIAIAVLMVIPPTRQLGLYAFFTTMLAFTGYIILLLNGAERPPCGCNALTEEMSLQAHGVMNLAFCALAAFAIALNEKKPDAPARRQITIANANDARQKAQGGQRHLT